MSSILERAKNERAYQYPVWFASSAIIAASVLALAIAAQSMMMYFLCVEEERRSATVDASKEKGSKGSNCRGLNSLVFAVDDLLSESSISASVWSGDDDESS